MTEKELINYFEEKHWNIRRVPVDMMGVSIEVTSPNGFVLAIRGGKFNHSTPKRKTEEYLSLIHI